MTWVGSQAIVRRVETPVRSPMADVTHRLAIGTVVARAKEPLMACRGMTEPEAHWWLQRTAMDLQLSMNTVAGFAVEQLSVASSRIQSLRESTH